MKIALIPHSQAKTSWELCEDLETVLLAEPRRFAWGEWVVDIEDYARTDKPACGTIGCLQGWMNLITASPATLVTVEEGFVAPHIGHYFPDDPMLQSDLHHMAYARYPFNGLTPADYVRDLAFDNIVEYGDDESQAERIDSWLKRSAIDRFSWETREEYAHRAIRGLRTFMTTHERRLRDNPIVIPERPNAPIISR